MKCNSYNPVRSAQPGQWQRQRGSNKNMNGLVRQYLPKGTDLPSHSQAQLDAIADEINARSKLTLTFAVHSRPTEICLEITT